MPRRRSELQGTTLLRFRRPGRRRRHRSGSGRIVRRHGAKPSRRFRRSRAGAGRPIRVSGSTGRLVAIPRDGPRDSLMERHRRLASHRVPGERDVGMGMDDVAHAGLTESRFHPLSGHISEGSHLRQGDRISTTGAAIHSRRLVIERSVRLTSNANAAAPNGIVSHQSNLAQGLVSRRTCKRGLW